MAIRSGPEIGPLRRRRWLTASLLVLIAAGLVVAALALVYGIPPNLIANTSTHPRTLAIGAAALALFLASGWVLYRLTRRVWIGALAQALLAAAVIALVVVPTFRGTEVHESDPLTGVTTAQRDHGQPTGAHEIGAADFVGIDHDATGSARLLDLGDGRRVLRFEDFEVEAGPDYFVHLIDGADVRTPEPVRLGALKGSRGDQNYEVPAEVEIGSASTVLIWCRVFDVPVANATF
ncbi:DM13 domain-containing protein [Rhodococcus daqingensis]|uniref:DM13 domain-containing protein n=1 Tax=Rhodococcus daqingensis TaxID=2479363 RepID=A0ABW2RYK2_9NOCA